jgi:hypothetical protein
MFFPLTTASSLAGNCQKSLHDRGTDDSLCVLTAVRHGNARLGCSSHVGLVRLSLSTIIRLTASANPKISSGSLQLFVIARLFSAECRRKLAYIRSPAVLLPPPWTATPSATHRLTLLLIISFPTWFGTGSVWALTVTISLSLLHMSRFDRSTTG